MDADAEAQCEAAISRALAVSPDSPEAHQACASMRISQQRLDDASASMSRALELMQGKGARRSVGKRRTGGRTLGHVVLTPTLSQRSTSCLPSASA